jgi:hypothetical protein
VIQDDPQEGSLIMLKGDPGGMMMAMIVTMGRWRVIMKMVMMMIASKAVVLF